MFWPKFLSELGELENVRAQFEWNRLSPELGRHYLHVGAERWDDRSDLPEGSSWLTISNKDLSRRFGADYCCSSVVDFVLHPPEGYFERWELWEKRPLTPQQAIDSIEFVVDDASPDSVLAVVMLLARLSGAELKDFFPRWIEVTDAWEKGMCGVGFSESWCALLSALGHRRFPIGTLITAEEMSAAWQDALRFTAQCLLHSEDPNAIPQDIATPEAEFARAALAQEEGTYFDWLQRATRLQLLVPQKETDRNILVDGLMIETEQFTGATKIFYRNDKKNSSLQQGFAFSAIHIPAQDGRNMDITISVDPAASLDLFGLWMALEEAECKAWEKAGAERPTDDPRELRHLESRGVKNRFAQPWYIDSSMTLLSRPRDIVTVHQPGDEIEENRDPGSRLNWEQVQDVIWNELNPLKSIAAISPNGIAHCPMLKLAPDKSPPEVGKVFLAARWGCISRHNALLARHEVAASSGLCRIFAAILAAGASGQPAAFSHYATPGDWRYIRLEGGFGIVSQSGVLLIDDGASSRLSFDALRYEFINLAKLDSKLNRFEADSVSSLVTAMREELSPKMRSSSLDKLLFRTVHAGVELLQIAGDNALLPTDTNARTLRDELQTEWCLQRKIDLFGQELRAIEDALRSLGELRTLRAGRFIATFGFGLLFATELTPMMAPAVFSMLFPKATMPGWWLMTFFGALLLITAWVIRLALRHRSKWLLSPNNKDDQQFRPAS